MASSLSPDRPFYLRVVRANAWYDLVVTAGFATPWTLSLVHNALSSAGDSLGLGATPELDLMQTLYANLMGTVVVIWATLRLVKPLPIHGLYDGIGRVLFATWMSYALAHGAPQWLCLFLAVEATLAVTELAPWLAHRKAGRVESFIGGGPRFQRL
ncbi:hypothetical protein [Streptomyces sp. NPDC052225]|uniref:hypothetical protein n=1 Tax=Streptomyces sp. NPDC052225 TaxID=3154949 RepID=UPI00341F6549